MYRSHTEISPASLVHRDRRVDESPSDWVRSFSCEDMRILVVCRGPVRKEAIDIFREMGVARVGMLLSEKDSIVYTNALAPELRFMRPEDVHRVRDYTGATREERNQRIAEIIDICKTSGYEYVFAGYGFMAEDESFVAALEKAGLRFVGPCSYTVRAAGQKDEAKKTALEQKVSVTPGVEDLTGRTLRNKVPSRAAQLELAKQHGLQVDADLDDERLVDAILDASYRAGVDVITVEEISDQLVRELTALFTDHPGRRIRLKAIGGGGGKGQRILHGPADASGAAEAARVGPEKYREILAEVKAGGVGDNKNVLLELNIEQTRHHEIQLLGNGSWCVALGGRDCSLQMHEQKLLEISITQESLKEEIERRREIGQTVQAAALQDELEVLTRMEEEAERFGAAVRLDSASTFECIVEGNRHYFMEVNTRIQVEHRVTELCYGLRFDNPERPGDGFVVTSLVEAMALLARHAERLPRPTRVRREAASVEARLNATDAALDPAAGGLIEYWSDPIEGEVRDDQGICTKNPDTGEFIRYRIAGAYDSNIALLVSVGGHRADSYEHLREVLRQTKLEGADLATNLEFHFGLVNFFLGLDVHAKPTTRFVVPYLTLVGRLKEEADKLDLGHALDLVAQHREARLKAAGAPDEAIEVSKSIVERKRTLVRRPIRKVLDHPHVLSGWLSALRDKYWVEDGRVTWKMNPVRALLHTYRVLNMGVQANLPAAQVIWDHDQRMLDSACKFYDELENRLDMAASPWCDIEKVLASETPPAGFDAELWAKVRAAHTGHQLGLELFDLLPIIAERAGFFTIKVKEDLTVQLPQFLQDPELQKAMKKVLVPPPVASGDEIVAATGGMYYAREAPDRPPMVSVGDHFEAGQPVYIIEVMKMFNKVTAPFSGTIEEVLIETDGTIVKKGQPLFRVRPDVPPKVSDPSAERAARQKHTRDLLLTLLQD